jgi:hypothetical protein
MTAERVAALAAVVEALAVVGALLFAWRQLSVLAATRRDQSRAYVVAFFDFEPDRDFPKLVVQNLGTTAAYKIRLQADPPLRSSLDEGPGTAIGEVGILKQGIATLAPGRQMSTVFDVVSERPNDWEDTYRIDVTYRDRSDKTWTDSFTLDLLALKHSTYVGEKGMTALVDEVHGLTKEVRSLRGETLQVEVEERAVRRARIKEERDRQMAEFEARQAKRQSEG